MTGYRLNRARGTILAVTLLSTAFGCATQTPRHDSSAADAARPAPAPDVRKHLIGPWWREHRLRLEGIRLGADGKLEVLGIHELRGTAWRVDGRKLHVRLRDADSGDLYEDELYIRRLTDRTLVVEAGDSYFAGTYVRHRPHDARFERAPQTESRPVAAVAATAGGDHVSAVPDPGAAIEPMLLRAVSAETLPPRAAWLTVVSELASCGQQLNRSICPRFYANASASLLAIEVCQPARSLAEGVHFIDARGTQASFPWFDAGFGRFVCDNGCNQDTGCRYEVTAISPAGRPTEVVYRFEVGATYGWVRLRLGRDGEIQVIGRELRAPQ